VSVRAALIASGALTLLPNRRTARALRIEIPAAVALRADRVIE
jgi:hypothetical protein